MSARTRGFSLEVALSTAFDMAPQRPWAVLVWGLLIWAPAALAVAAVLGLSLPTLLGEFRGAEIAGTEPDQAIVIPAILRAQVAIYLAQPIQWGGIVLVTTAVIRSVLKRAEQRPPRAFALSLGMPELLTAVCSLALTVGLYSLLALLALIGLGIGLAVQPLPSPFDTVIISAYAVLVLAGVLWLAARLSLVTAASVDTRTLAFEEGWRMSKGRVGWLILLVALSWMACLAIILIFYAVVIVAVLVTLGASGLLNASSGQALAWSNSWPLTIVGLIAAIAGAWLYGFCQFLTTGSLTSAYAQIKAGQEKADAAAPDALSSPEL